MSDIVERLREQAPGTWYESTLIEAGAEIERLREEIAVWKDRYESLLRDAQASEAAFDKAMKHGGL